MTEVEKRRARRKREYITAWIVVYLFEFFTAVIPTAIAAGIIIPLAASSRGYFAIGGEWTIIPMVYWISYRCIHNRICDRLFGKKV